MDITFTCYQCGVEIPDAGSIPNYKKYARPTLETSGKRTFCCEECYQKYLKDRQVGEYNGLPIYKKVLDGKEYFVPYIEAWYGFENIEDCKKRISMTNVAVVDPEMFAQHNQMMFGD